MIATWLVLTFLTAEVQGRIGTSTAYDGQFYSYNSYLNFGGSVGLKFDLSGSAISVREYSMSIWFRPTATAISLGKSLSIVTLQPGFECYLTTRARVQCESDKTSGNALNADGDVRLSNWYLLFLMVSSSTSELQVRELSNTLFSSVKGTSYFPPAYSKLEPYTAYIGINKDFKSEGFMGSIRYLQLFPSNVGASVLYQSQFTLIQPSDLSIQIRLSSLTDITDSVSSSKGQVSSQKAQLTNVQDFTANWYCYNDKDASSIPLGSASNIFDSVTCNDQKTKLLMSADTSYASSYFTPQVELLSYTVEFWTKPTQTVTGNAFYFALAVQQGSTIMSLNLVISQETNTYLYCYINYDQNKSESMQYLDYANDIKKWQHIACIVDADLQIAEGMYYNGQYDYVYYSQFTSKPALLKGQKYLAILNSNPKSYSRGIKNALYAELRFWSYARTTQDIKDFQFHQLNVTWYSANLLSYFKLMTGDVTQQGEIDLADSNLKKSVTLNNVAWQQQTTDLGVCPLGLYKGSTSDPLCYREGINKFQVFVIKNSTHYILTPFYTLFRNTFLRNNISELFQIQWTLNSLNVRNTTNQNLFDKYFNPQKNSKELVFSYDQTSNMPGTYTFTAQMIDQANQMNQQSASFQLRTYRCLSIFDKDSEESVVLMNMNTKRNEQNAVFSYGFTSCGNYVFKKDLLTVDIDFSDKINLLTSDHNQAAQTFTLRASVQQYLPLNEYFYIRIKGVWQNQNDASDQITYYLIYGCRYISKVVPVLTPNNYLILQGQSLELSVDAQFMNMPSNVVDRTYTVSWICPSSLQYYCRSQTSNVLTIPYSIYLNSNQPFFTSIPIFVLLTTNFIQGDGTKNSYGSIRLMWADVNPNAQSMVASPIISKEYPVVLQVSIFNLDDSKLSVAWSSSPSISTLCYLNGNNQKQFVLNQTCIKEGTKYNISCDIYYLSQSQVIWTSYNSIQLPDSPKGGKVTCNRTSGAAFTDIFYCQSTGWSISGSSARHQFYITEARTGKLIPISGLTSSNSFTNSLPPTSRITVKVVDSNNGIAYDSLTLSVTNQLTNTTLVSRLSILVSTASSAQSNGNLQAIVAANQAASMLQSQGNVSFINISATQQISLLELQTSICNTIVFQATRLRSLISDEPARRSFIQNAVSSMALMTRNSGQFNAANAYNMARALNALINGTFSESLNYLMYDDSFNYQFFNVFENIYNNLRLLLKQGKITNAMMDPVPERNETLSNLSKAARTTLGVYERFISTNLPEGQSFYYNNTAFSFLVTKFSRMAQNMGDQASFYPNGEYTSYNFPLSAATEPSDRQSFAVINFKSSPFSGDWFLNQSTTSDSSVYFSYRDSSGAYLDNTYLSERIQITFKYEYSPFIFLPNVTTCGYIGLSDSQWENNSCSVEFSRVYGNITCHCLHMSYYSIIDDYLVRPSRVPLVILTFRNWSSFIVFLYMILIFVLGTIYTFNKDNQDFRYLHEQEELQGGTELSSEDSVNLISLTLKRKVFFMNFAEGYKFSNLMRLYVMLLHPLFQLKYRLDPEHPRFYRFLLLFTRLMILFAICFFILKDVDNFEDLSDSGDLGLAVAALDLSYQCRYQSCFFVAVDPDITLLIPKADQEKYLITKWMMNQ